MKRVKVSNNIIKSLKIMRVTRMGCQRISLPPKTTMLKILTKDGVNNRETSLINTKIIM